MAKNIKLDMTTNNSRPDLQVNSNRIIGPGLPGSFILVDGKHQPNLNDEAMKGRNQKSEIRSQKEEKKEEKKTDAVDKSNSAE